LEVGVVRMNSATPILSEIQSKTFAETAIALVDGKDLSYKGFSLSNQAEPFVLNGTAAIRNKVMLWLVSSRGDYVREPDKGGPLGALIGKTFTEDNQKFIERSLTMAFSDFFQGDLSLIKVTAEPDIGNRRWKIKLIVNDPIRRELFDIAVGVTQ